MASGNRVKIERDVPGQITPFDRAELKELVDQVRAVLAARQGDDVDTARRKLDDLEKAITSDEADLAAMEDVRGWFVRNLPTLASAVGRIISTRV